MKLSKDIIIELLLLAILFISRAFYEEFKLFLIFIPLYILILYINLKRYYNDYSIIRFSSYKSWIAINIMLIFEHCIIASFALCLDKLFISATEDMNLILLFIEYFLFLILISGILILPYLNIIRSVITSITVLILIKTKIFSFSILNPLYDGRQFNIEGGILRSIAVILALDFIIYFIYFLITKKKVRSYGYESLKKSPSKY